MDISGLRARFNHADLSRKERVEVAERLSNRLAYQRKTDANNPGIEPPKTGPVKADGAKLAESSVAEVAPDQRRSFGKA